MTAMLGYPLGRVARDVYLVQPRRPYLLLALRRLADRPVFREPGDPLGFDPVVVGPGLARYRLERLHRVEPRETVLHCGGPQVIGKVTRSLGLDRLALRRGAEARGRRRRWIVLPVAVLRLVRVGRIKIVVARLERTIVVLKIDRRADPRRRRRGPEELPVVRRCPYLVVYRRTDPGRGRRRSAPKTDTP